MKRTILIVDDEPQFVEMLDLRLTAHNYRVITARNGEQGVVMAKTQKPDLILMDVMMPGMDGGQAAQAIRAAPATANIPIIFLTAMVGKEEVDDHNGRIGGGIFVSKTAGPAILLERIRLCLSENPKAAGGAAHSPPKTDESRLMAHRPGILRPSGGTNPRRG